MSGLRLRAEMMHAAIETERRLAAAERARDAALARIDAITTSATRIAAEAQAIADAAIAASHRPTMTWHRATAEVAALRALMVAAGETDARRDAEPRTAP